MAGTVDDLTSDVRFVITENPALSGKPGDSLYFRPLMPRPDVRPRTADVDNWQYFEGILLAITFSDGASDWILGSAVVVASGIALCATHVIAEHLNELMTGRVTVVCWGIARHGVEAWRIRHVTPLSGTDLSILSLEYSTVLPPDRIFHRALITTRLPAIGEKLVLIGFRAARERFLRGDDGHTVLEARVVLSSGNVCQQFPYGRDRLLVPWPALEIDCPAWGGMSGGPVFDSRGFLVGLISRSMEAEDEPSPTISMLLWPSLGQKIPGGWPGAPREPSSLLERAAGDGGIENPSAVTVTIDTATDRMTTAYSPWT